MVHPRMYRDDDPYLSDLRKLALAFPESHEVEAWGYAPPYWGPGGWLALDFEAASVDWHEVRELIDASYRQVALKRMVHVLEAEGSGG